jgi:hypothetical protein
MRTDLQVEVRAIRGGLETDIRHLRDSYHRDFLWLLTAGGSAALSASSMSWHTASNGCDRVGFFSPALVCLQTQMPKLRPPEIFDDNNPRRRTALYRYASRPVVGSFRQAHQTALDPFRASSRPPRRY